MIDLSTTYLGLPLKNPIVASASPLTRKLDNFKRLEDAGAAAIVMHSLFEEEIALASHQLDYFLNYAEESFPEALNYFPAMEYNIGPDDYIELLHRARQTVSIPVIGSLNGISAGGWLDYAQKIEQAGADALELNIYYVASNPDQTSDEIEEMYLDLVREVKSSIHIPVAVKLGSQFTSFANFAKKLDGAGVNGIVLFNRFYQPDIDLENLEVVSNLDFSTSYELRLRLRWIAILYGCIQADMAVTGGVHTGRDVLKAMMAGANIAMTTSSVLEKGISHLSTLLKQVNEWMYEHEYESIQQMRGSMSQKSVPMPTVFERANYMKVLASFRPSMS
ncbi:MAG: dihydroorotate dehydrogenase-like protein [Anaerolineae bacterium]